MSDPRIDRIAWSAATAASRLAVTPLLDLFDPFVWSPTAYPAGWKAVT